MANTEAPGVHIPDLLLPKAGTDLSKWAVVACDQYTSQPEYWEDVNGIIGDAPSTLQLIFPEVYLEAENKLARIATIQQNMAKYLAEEILVPMEPGLVYLDRQTSHAKSRKGLMVALDLEQYDYNKGSQTLVRATEGTVLDRLPPRIQVREGAPLELPHIMVLIDDPDRTVIEPLAESVPNMELLYDFDLMKNGGHIKGYRLDKSGITPISTAIKQLADPQRFMEKYGVDPEKGVLLFAVGDGNHSLATAKACWERLKPTLPPEEQREHPARYALVELVNVHDDGIQFEPIHRVVFNIDADEMLQAMILYCQAQGEKLTVYAESVNAATSGENVHVIDYITSKTRGSLVIENPKHNLAVGSLQSFLDDYLRQQAAAKIDYIHGEDVVTSLGSKPGNIGFYLPPMDKNDLFKTVILDGVLPRKTFSMGEAEEKRFYLECRKISR